MLRRIAEISIAALMLSACSGTTTDTTGGGGGGTSTSTATNGTSTGGDTAHSRKYKSYVALGDSISNTGGVQNSPAKAYTHLLVKNDDTTYPAWTGMDFTTKFPGIATMTESSYGATAGTTTGTPASGGTPSQSVGLQNQIKALPATLEGPVLITLTIGGNDMMGAAEDIVLGSDSSDRATFSAELKAAFDTLTAPDHFGPGVEVFIFQANIYDPADGSSTHLKTCPQPLSEMATFNIATAPFWNNWNTVVTTVAPSYANLQVLPLYTLFSGHGVGETDSWFYSDCLHPTAFGHDQIRAMFWTAITGEAAPQE